MKSLNRVSLSEIKLKHAGMYHEDTSGPEENWKINNWFYKMNKIIISTTTIAMIGIATLMIALQWP